MTQMTPQFVLRQFSKQGIALCRESDETVIGVIGCHMSEQVTIMTS